MRLRIEIDLDNAAFVECGPDEVERILLNLASRLPDPLDQTGGELSLHDLNGNHCGFARIDNADAKRWLCRFTGRLAGAIGIMHPCEVTVEAVDAEAAQLACYDTHEHISEFSAALVDG